MSGVRTLVCAVLALLVVIPGSAPAATDSTQGSPLPDRHGAVCDYGITLAFRGELAAAESVFISLLSMAPGDARALTNLGNVYLLRGELNDALAFFARAQRKDRKDAGIVLDRAIAYLLMGKDEEALGAAGDGIGMAGGLDAAASLLGIRLDGRPSDSVKTGARVYLSKGEIRALLETAAAVPADSVSVPKPPAHAATPGKRGRKRIWRSAGARGGENREAAELIYWKR